MMRFLRSILAVVAGIAASAVLVTLCDAIMLVVAPASSGQDEPIPLPLLVVMSVYSILIAFFAGWLIARLAPSRPVEHAAVYAGLSVLVTAIAQGMGAPSPMPVAWTWITVAGIVLASLAGARFYMRRHVPGIA